MELGAGEGRVVSGLIERKYDGDIYAIERPDNLCKCLFNKYKTFRNVHILQMNLLNNKLPNADIGLWLWSGILEFSKNQQLDLVKKIRKKVSTLVIDTPRIGAETNATFQGRQFAEIKTDWGIIRAYMPCEEDMQLYAKNAGLNLKEVISYETRTERKRIIYIL